MSPGQESMGSYSSMPVGRNYYSDAKESADGLKYRLDGEDVIRKIVNDLRGVELDQYGRPVQDAKVFPVMNEEGIHQTRMFLKVGLGKITHLTKFANEDRVLRQQRWLAGEWAFQIALHRKLWHITNKDVVQEIVESTIFAAMLRAESGFENNNVSRSYSVQEHIDHQQGQQPGMGSRLFGMFGRGGNRG